MRDLAILTTYTVNTHGAYAPGGVVLFIIGSALVAIVILVMAGRKK